MVGLLEIRLISIEHCFVDLTSINYTARAVACLFVSLNKGRVEGHYSVLSANKKPNYQTLGTYTI